ncbi:hypothetical protein ACE2AL_08070 [Providencia sp. SKLX074055]|uniref:hypothetical protein n=1 Tax=Providencia xihuensis TaxID=3342830 RepID=UPI0035C14731
MNKRGLWEWPFILSLGCWGVTNGAFQLAAFTITLLFFSERFIVIAKSSTFTTKKEYELFKKIRGAKVADDEFYELIKQLKNVIKNRSFFKPSQFMNRIWKFMVSYSFLICSFAYAVNDYFKT